MSLLGNSGSLLRNVGLQHLCPQQNEYFDGRWDRISKEVVDVLRNGLNSLVILGTWTLWNDHNKCISDGASLSVARALSCGGDNTPTDHGMGRPQAHHRSPRPGGPGLCQLGRHMLCLRFRGICWSPERLCNLPSGLRINEAKN